MQLFAIICQTAVEIIKSCSDKTKVKMERCPSWGNPTCGCCNFKKLLKRNEIGFIKYSSWWFFNIGRFKSKFSKTNIHEDWKSLLYGYLELSQLPLLEVKGKVSSDEAKAHAINEYKEFRINQDRNYESNFDNLIKSIKRLKGKK